jgi:hypothetical protein
MEAAHRRVGEGENVWGAEMLAERVGGAASSELRIQVGCRTARRCSSGHSRGGRNGLESGGDGEEKFSSRLL